MLSVDIKVIPKAVTKKLKKSRSRENRSLISNITKICNTKYLKVFLVTMNIKKLFHSVDHEFFISFFIKVGEKIFT